MAKSLLEETKAGSSAAPTKRAGKKNDGAKLLFAVALLVIAGVVVAYSNGWILGGDNAPKPSPQEQAKQQQEFDVQQKHIQEQMKKGVVKPAGTS